MLPEKPCVDFSPFAASPVSQYGQPSQSAGYASQLTEHAVLEIKALIILGD